MGLHCVTLGGGRHKTTDEIDPGVGFVLTKKVSDKVEKGEELVKIYHNKNQQNEVKEIMAALRSEILISKDKVKAPKLVYEVKVKKA